MTSPISRREFVASTAAMIAVAGFAASTFANSEGDNSMSDDALRRVLNASMSEKRGVTLVADGATIALVVTEIGESWVAGRSQQYDHIVVKISEISAAYM